jgi:hypothetical protein
MGSYARRLLPHLILSLARSHWDSDPADRMRGGRSCLGVNLDDSQSRLLRPMGRQAAEARPFGTGREAGAGLWHLAEVGLWVWWQEVQALAGGWRRALLAIQEAVAAVALPGRRRGWWQLAGC